MKRVLLTPVLAAMLVAGCGGETPELRVLCGSSMAEPMKEVVTRFQGDTGIAIELTLGGCETLLPQVELGAPADLFIGHAPFDDLLKEKGLRQDELVILGAISPAVVALKGNPKGIVSLQDLTRDDVDVGLPDSRYSTCGEYFEAAARERGLLAAIQARTVYTTRTHQELATALRTKSVDVVVVWNFIAAMHRDNFEVVPVDVSFPSADVFVTVLKRPESPESAQRLLEFLKLDFARDTFHTMGYSKAPKAKNSALITLQLYCAAGIQKPVDDLVALFKKRQPNVKFEVVYQGAGTLLAQIELKKTGDLYVAGDEVFMELAREKGLLLHAKRMAAFTPVLAVPKGNPQQVASFKDLDRPGLRLGLGEEQATAVGKIARALLEEQGSWTDVQKNVVVTAGTVTELAIQTALGSLDASIIWSATAWQFRDRIDVTALGDPGFQVGVPIGVLAFCEHRRLADAFVELATSSEAAPFFEKHGFEVPESADHG